MGKVTCPHCNKVADHWLVKDEIPDEFFWCNFCGKLSLFDKNKYIRTIDDAKAVLRAPTEQEIEKIYGQPEDPRLNSKMWLPTVQRDNIRFEVMILHNGVFNDNDTFDFNFVEAERYLKLMFHKTGALPQVGDFIEGVSEKKFGEARPNGYMDRTFDFVIVGRCWGKDDYEVMQLYVVTEENWLAKNKY